MVVIAFDIAEYFAAHACSIAQFMAVNPFDFERMKKAFCHGVVVTATGFAHALADFSETKTVPTELACVLASAIGVEDESRGRLTLPQGHINRLDDDGLLQAWSTGPADHLPRIQIDEGCQIFETLGRLQIGDITDPAFIGRIYREILLQQVGRDHGMRIDHGGVWTEFPLLLGPQAHLTHQPLNLFEIDALTQPTQLMRDPWSTIITTMLLENASNHGRIAIIINETP